MRFFIAYLLSGKAKAAHEKLVHEIERQFHPPLKLSGYIPPHITLKNPFVTDDISDIEQVVSAVVARNKKAPLRLHGFDTFPPAVIYIDIASSQRADVVINDLTDSLRAISWLTFGEFESPRTLHASVLRESNPDTFRRVTEFLKDHRFDFEVKLDNISILKHDGARWLPYRMYSLQ